MINENENELCFLLLINIIGTILGYMAQFQTLMMCVISYSVYFVCIVLIIVNVCVVVYV